MSQPEVELEGCGSHSCVIKKPVGQGTNSGCLCNASTLRLHIQKLNRRPAPIDGGGLDKKIDGNTSDGYHTFNELYDHRVLLWINYCLTNPQGTYLVEEHYDGWFLLGKETTYGQVSYHCPNKYLNLVENIERRHPEFDGHSSNAVLVRLEHLAKFGTPPTKGVSDLVLAAKRFVQWFDYVHEYHRANLIEGQTLETASKNWDDMVTPSPPITELKEALAAHEKSLGKEQG